MKRPYRLSLLLGILGILLLVLAFAGAAQAKQCHGKHCPPPTATPSATPTATPVPTAIPSPTATPTATVTPLTRTLEDYPVTQGGVTLTLPIYTSQLIAVRDDSITHAIVIIHGSSLTADNYFDYVSSAITGLPHAFLVAPKFQDGTPSGQLSWSSGWSQCNKSLTSNAFRISSCAVLDQIVASIHASFPNAGSVVIAGFSAGGQMVTRYAATNADARNVYLVGSPSSYLYLSNARPGPRCTGDNDYKYGLANLSVTGYMSAVGAAALTANFGQAEVHTLVGSLDNDPADSSMDTRCEAEAQGATRLDRMWNYRDHITSVYGTSSHTFAEVAGAAHSANLVLNSAAAKAVLWVRHDRQRRCTPGGDEVTRWDLVYKWSDPDTQSLVDAVTSALENCDRKLLAAEAAPPDALREALERLVNAWSDIRPAVTIVGSGPKHQELFDALEQARAALRESEAGTP